MTQKPAVGFHASQEQFAPSRLLRLCQQAEEAGFGAAKASDHFHPWGLRQGQSGATWSWLGAAMQACTLPFGTITAPGYRYHPAVIAQSAATLAEMFPGRFWLAMGSGEAVNEAITGLPWPEKAERNARLAECADIIRALLDGEEVTHRGRITVIEARLFTRPDQPVPLIGAAVTAETAKEVAKWADGLLTVGGKADDVRKVLDAFREHGGDGKPVHIQHALSWAPTLKEAQAEAMHQWRHGILAGEAMWDLRRPQDFDRASDHATIEQLEVGLPISDDLGRHAADIATLIALGATVHLHCVGRNQEAFIDAFGTRVLPDLESRP
jgi:coenzyme F420-dependent glucose-6-phosphate dehydrogenase